MIVYFWNESITMVLSAKLIEALLPKPFHKVYMESLIWIIWYDIYESPGFNNLDSDSTKWLLYYITFHFVLLHFPWRNES